MSLLQKLKSAGSIPSEVLSESNFFKPKDFVQTPIPIINTAFSGKMDGGITSGLTVIAGPSKNYKSNFGLICVKAYLDKYPEAVCLFYDSEFGITSEYLTANGIDTSRVIHLPIEHVEQLKFDIRKKLDSIEKGERVIIFVDSLGNLASKKEVEDAQNEKAVADMSRAKQIKSLFRIITPSLTIKNIPCIVVNHTYEETGMFPKQIVSGGTGVYYSANTIFIVGRSQEKTGTDIVGWNFTLVVEKSRFVKEKSRLTFQVLYEEGMNKYSGLLDLALESGHVTKPSMGWFQKKGSKEKVRAKDTNTEEFWTDIVTNPEFSEWVSKKYMLATNTSYPMEELDD
jgi:RecA/RadA recombinase